MTDPAPRLAPRSAVAAADFELLRVARTDLAEAEAPAASLAGRIRRELAAFRVGRPEAERDAGRWLVPAGRDRRDQA